MIVPYGPADQGLRQLAPGGERLAQHGPAKHTPVAECPARMVMGGIVLVPMRFIQCWFPPSPSCRWVALGWLPPRCSRLCSPRHGFPSHVTGVSAPRNSSTRVVLVWAPVLVWARAPHVSSARSLLPACAPLHYVPEPCWLRTCMSDRAPRASVPAGLLLRLCSSSCCRSRPCSPPLLVSRHSVPPVTYPEGREPTLSVSGVSWCGAVRPGGFAPFVLV